MREISIFIVFLFTALLIFYLAHQEDMQRSIQNGKLKPYCGSPATAVKNIQKVTLSHIYYFKDDQDTLLSVKKSDCIVIKIKDPLKGKTCVLQTQ